MTKAVTAFVNAGIYEQLVLYFSGHGYWKNNAELWLLSKAPGNADEAVSWVETIELARDSGIPHVVVISDACRSIPTTPRSMRVRGSVVFPNNDAADATVAALRRGGVDTAYNIADDTPVTWRRYVEAIAAVVSAPRPMVLPGWLLRALAPYAGLFMTRVNMAVSNARARQDLGWTPKHPSYLDGIAA